MAETNAYDPDELLTKMECMHLFCEKLKIEKDSYYKYYRDYIKFKSIAPGSNLMRIPYGVALGILALVQNQYKPEKHPPIDELIEFMDKVPDELNSVE